MASIDVNEILKSSLQPPEKRPRIDTMSTANSSPEEILNALMQDNSNQNEIDETTVKRICLQLEKKHGKNREMRIKYVDEPQKFMDSEIDLSEAVQETHAVAAQPDLYHVLVESNAIQTLIQLISHENTDIVAAVLNLIQELTDVEILHESQEGAEILVNELLRLQIVETIVQQAFLRLKEDIRDEADAISNGLSIIENILDFRPEASDICVQQGLFNWLLKRATKKGVFDGNKLFASQLLHQLLQSTEDARIKLIDGVDGIDQILRALAAYKRHDPQAIDEREHMENLFDALCAALFYKPNRQFFLDGEGLQLMILMLREKKQSREGSLKVISYATAIPDGGPNCDKFVEISGLKTLFPLLMRSPPRIRRKDTNPDDHEEYCCSIIDALLFSCNETNKQRILQKFSDHGFEKVDRLIELYLQYSDRVRKFTQKLERKVELEPDELYIEKLNNGLYVLQRIVVILAEVCVNSAGCYNRASKIFKMRMRDPLPKTNLEAVLFEFHSNLGPEADSQKQRVEHLLARLSSLADQTDLTV